MKCYAVCVGHYKSISETKNVQKKMLELNLRADVNSCEGGYTLKVFYSITQETCENIKVFLEKKGYEAFVS